MSSLGIYFGPKLIDIVDSSGIKVIKNISLPLNRMQGPDLEEKVPEEIKIVSLLNDELSRNKITAKEASIVVSGKDLIIRTFDIPFIPVSELSGAVNFEVKKYIPFKVEELISDFQIQRNKTSMKNLVLFAGIKKDSLEKYFSVLKQLELKINSIEYSAFSILRLIKLAKVNQKGIVAVLNIDIKGEDEANFIVLKDGFPLFSRDIIFTSDYPLDTLEPPVNDPLIMMEKLRTELRVSLDFYSRKFPAWNIERIYYLACDESQQELESFFKEKNLFAQSLNLKKIIGSDTVYSSGFLKAYTGSLAKSVKNDLSIDLLKAKLKPKGAKEANLAKQATFGLPAIPVDPKVIIVAIAICLWPYLFGFLKSGGLKKDLSGIFSQRTKLSSIKNNASYDEVKSMVSKYKKKIEILNKLINKQVFYTEVLDVLPRLVPEDIWLTGIDSEITKDIKIDPKKPKNAPQLSDIKSEITLTGSVYNVDKDKMLEIINNFASALKEDPVFAKYFDIVNIQTIDQFLDSNGNEIFNFVLTCRNHQ